MGYNIGLPSLKLNNVGFSSKNCGSFVKVASEALSERKGRDIDIDPTRANLNEYEGFSTAKELTEYSENHVAEINQWRSEHGKSQSEKRALRADTVVMCAMIVKPPAELMESLTPEQQKQLLHDSVDFIKGVVGKDNVKAVAYHYDELVPHAHIFWEPNAGEGRLCAKEKHNTKNYFRPINKGLPAHLRSKGWTMIDDCNAYDAAKEQELREEMGAEDYAKHRAAVKAKRGQDSKTFKHQADKEVAEKLALAQEQERMAEQARQQREADERASEELQAENDKLEQERRENTKRNIELQHRQSTLLHNVGGLSAKVDDLKQQETNIALNVESLVKNEEGCKQTIEQLEKRITSLTTSQENLTDSVQTLQQKADRLTDDITETEQRAEIARSELSGIITQTEQQKSELAEIQDKVLGYKISEKKHFGETSAAYDARIATAQQAVAIAQRTEALNERESKLNARDTEQNTRERNLDWKEKNIDAIVQNRAKEMAAKPIADAGQETAIARKELTAERTAHNQTRTRLADAIARLRDALLSLFPPYWKHINSNAHQRQAESLRRGENHADLVRRQRHQPIEETKSQNQTESRLSYRR